MATSGGRGTEERRWGWAQCRSISQDLDISRRNIALGPHRPRGRRIVSSPRGRSGWVNDLGRKMSGEKLSLQVLVAPRQVRSGTPAKGGWGGLTLPTQYT